MQTSNNFVKSIIASEGFELEAYRDSKGIPTIGIGTIKYPDGVKVKMGDKCTEEQAYFYLNDYVKKMVIAINKLIKNIEVNQNQFDAICSLTYNIGTTGFTNSTVLRLMKKNPKDPLIKEAWLAWNKETKNGIKVPSKGLTNRRKREYQLYCTPV
jgi:lysozyme